MAMSELVDDYVQVSLLATSGHAGLAASMLEQRFGLTRQDAETVLDQGYGLLTARLGAAEARKVVPLLATLGLRVAVQPVEALPPDTYCDLSIRLVDVKAAPELTKLLDRLMGLSGLTIESFNGPAGLVVPALSSARAEWLCNKVRQVSGVHVTLSEHQMARHDLFAPSGLTEAEDASLRRYLRLLGCSTGSFGDAVATGLDRRVLNKILQRFPDLDLVGVNQAFQRHELLIIGKGTLTSQEFADFLMTRPVAQSIPMRRLMNSLPLRVESCLTRSAAKQFLNDYSAIGIQTITRLVWAPLTPVENP